MEGLLADLDKAQRVALDLVQRMKRCQSILAEIALRPNVMPSEEYLRLMIENENNNQKAGYQNRVRALENLKQRSELVKQINNPNFDILADYKANNAVKVGVKRMQSRSSISFETVGSWFGF